MAVPLEVQDAFSTRDGDSTTLSAENHRLELCEMLVKRVSLSEQEDKMRQSIPGGEEKKAKDKINKSNVTCIFNIKETKNENK
jgi:hypothetical protein